MKTVVLSAGICLAAMACQSKSKDETPTEPPKRLSLAESYQDVFTLGVGAVTKHNQIRTTLKSQNF